MPGQVVTQPNPPALPSRLPDNVLDLLAKPERKPLPKEDVASLKAFQRAANYIAASMIFLKGNVLLEKDLSFDDIKPRLLGHWGTCPGLVLIWSHLNLLIRNHGMDMIYVIGPGHGAPAALASLWLEGSLEKFYPDKYGVSKQGLKNLITGFSVPGGFPSHINSESPGSIHEGGELGYALAVAFGAVMDNPDLIVTCVVGDGEAESGPTAAAWHAIKYIDPAESGAVIPILHVNGFKISERTIFGCMDDKEIVALFSGYGYQVYIAEDLDDIDAELASTLEWAVAEIKMIQTAARKGAPIVKPRWPMIVLRTPKGWTGPKTVDGQIVEGSFKSHQVPIAKPKESEEHLGLLQDWLSSYVPSEVLPGGKPTQSILDLLPANDKRLGQLKQTYDPHKTLDLPDWTEFAVDKDGQASCTKKAGDFIDRVSQANPGSFRIFSPDELESNKLDAILEHSGRNMQWDDSSRAKGGRVIEILSEHCCQGFMQGYTLTGRTALFPSYESFLGIVHTMMVQYSKFNKMARETGWRGDLASINYIESSTWARQEHNGFSHQNPSFIGSVLNLKAEAARVYLPPDANCFLSTVHHCLKSKNYVNLMIGSKHPTRTYLSPEEAAEHCRKGASVWKFASSEAQGQQPDVVLVGVGVEVTFEVVKAAALLRELLPDLRVRVVNVTDLMVLATESRHPHALSPAEFSELFTEDRPVLFNYHGYAAELQGLVFGRPGLHRMTVEGYKEEGSTTTPFDMMMANTVSRYHVAERAVRAVQGSGDGRVKGLDEALQTIRKRVEETHEYIMANGKDPDDTYVM